MKNQQGAPEALRTIRRFYRGNDCMAENQAGDWVRYEDHVAALVEAQQPATHVQNPAEIEHVAGDVSKNGPESNMAQQPAPSAARPVTPYTCPKCHALWLHWPAEQTGFGRDTLNCRSADHCHYCEKAGVEQLQRLERVPAVLSAPQPSPTPQADSQPAPADVEDAIAWLVTWKGGEHTYAHAHASELPAVNQARMMGGTVTPCVAAPTPPAQAADSVLEDAARYRWLRNKSTVLHNTAWLGGTTAVQRDVDFLRRDDALAALDAAIDAARKQGANHD